MEQQKLRVGIIGAGFWTGLIHIPALQASKNAEIVAISRRNSELLEKIKNGTGVQSAYTDWREMIENEQLDAVIVATTHASHAEPTIAALKKGIHVLVEKPIASTSKDAWAMAAAQRESGKILMVSYQSRYHPVYQTVKRALDAGTIGTVRQVQATCSQNIGAFLSATPQEELEELMKGLGQPEWFKNAGIVPGDWRSNPEEMGGGMFADTGSHFTDLALWFAGSQAKTVIAFSEPPENPQEAYLSVQIRMTNGTLISLSSNTITPGNMFAAKNNFRILGDLGTLSCDGERILVERVRDREDLPVEGQIVTSVQAFLSAILDGGINLTPADEAARVVEVTEAAYISVKEGRTVQLRN
ncbi:Gfo/Idh/MocA family protein [Paenibacillus montanisoli]|nr:Gfo/Idh/MocA family oxidoreductase [Paenibacillus montanisoli]